MATRSNRIGRGGAGGGACAREAYTRISPQCGECTVGTGARAGTTLAAT